MPLCAVHDSPGTARELLSELCFFVHGDAGMRSSSQVPEPVMGIRQIEASVSESLCCWCSYTHVLKTDDDCYIRYPALAATLQQPDKAAPDKGALHMQMMGVYKGTDMPVLCMPFVLSEVCIDATGKAQQPGRCPVMANEMAGLPKPQLRGFAALESKKSVKAMVGPQVSRGSTRLSGEPARLLCAAQPRLQVAHTL